MTLKECATYYPAVPQLGTFYKNTSTAGSTIKDVILAAPCAISKKLETTSMFINRRVERLQHMSFLGSLKRRVNQKFVWCNFIGEARVRNRD